MITKSRVIKAITLFIPVVFLACQSKVSITERFEHFGETDFIVALPQLPPLITKDGYEIGVSASECSACHTEIYDEWSQATHATALKDIQYQAELAKESSPKWLCLNCHIPIQNQREYLVQKDTQMYNHKYDIRGIVKEENPDFDSAMQSEAITCATCHIRVDEQGKSYVIGAYDSEVAPHPVQKNREFLRDICMRCHSPGGKELTASFQCWFKTKEELDAGPVKKDCVDCHMPVTMRKAVPGHDEVPVRQGHKHHWTGGGVPKWYSAYDTLLERGYEPGLSLEIKNVSLNQKSLNVKVEYQNDKAGHWLPTGDPERFLLFRAALVDTNGNEVLLKELHIGQEWDWGDEAAGRPAQKIHDDRLRPLEKRTWNLVFDRGEIPSASASLDDKKLVITVIHVRLKTENAKYMMQATGINETFLPNGQELVKNAVDHYPFASFIYKAEISLNNQKTKVYSLRELIELSKQEKGKPLEERVY